MTTGNATAVTEGGLVRKASGLVRSWSPLDAWIYNVIAINIVLNVAVSYALLAVLYPRASQWLAFLIAGAFCTLEAVVYVFFTTAMPRSGGDYVFQSRVLGGAWASLFAFTAVTLSQIVWMALAAWFGANIIASPFLTILGVDYGAHWMIRLGTWFQTGTGIFVTGIVVTAWAAFVNIRGMRVYALLQRWFFAAGALGLLVVLITLLATSHQTFVNNFNSFMAGHYHVQNAFQTVIQRAGSVDSSFSLGATMLATVVAAFALIYPAWGVQQAGEIKRANSLRANMFGIVGAEIFSFVIVAITAALLVSRVGGSFLHASGDLFYNKPDANPLPVPPFFGFFTALLVTGSWFTWIVFIMFFAWYWMWFTNITLGGTRVMIAMSFDRVLPEWIGKVNRRTHTPINAIIVFSIACIGLTAMYAYIHNFFKVTLGLTVLNITGFAATMVAGAVFPWVKRELFNSTAAARYKIASIPLITLSALAFLGFAVYVDYQSLTADELGINGRTGLLFVGGCYVVAAVVYLTARIYRKYSENLDLEIVYRELPAE
jgi:APA family basic amino acid/polyamine antiporter